VPGIQPAPPRSGKVCPIWERHGSGGPPSGAVRCRQVRSDDLQTAVSIRLTCRYVPDRACCSGVLSVRDEEADGSNCRTLPEAPCRIRAETPHLPGSRPSSEPVRLPVYKTTALSLVSHRHPRQLADVQRGCATSCGLAPETRPRGAPPSTFPLVRSVYLNGLRSRERRESVAADIAPRRRG
jgi:hypothetical protein